jgi:hypothetical protein
VPLDLARDGGDGEGGELVAPLGIAALDGVEEADRPDLDQVLVLGPAAAVTVGERLDQGQVELDEAVARSRVAVVAVGGEEASGCRLAFGASVCRRRLLSGP